MPIEVLTQVFHRPRLHLQKDFLLVQATSLPLVVEMKL
jgi:hypothetical protein